MALRIHKETQMILCDFLKSLAELERKSEILRQTICSKETFSPYEMFKRIDHFNHGKIQLQEIQDFLREYDHKIEDQDLILFLQNNTNDGDLVINYKDFLSIILPRDDAKLRYKVAQKQPQRMDKGTKLELETEITFAKFINEKINRETITLMGLEGIKLRLAKQADGQASELFVSIDTLNNLHVGAKDLDRFFRRNGRLIQEVDLQRIFNRIDPKGVGFITEQGLSKILYCNLQEMNQEKHQLLKKNYSVPTIQQPSQTQSSTNKKTQLKKKSFDYSYPREKQIKVQRMITSPNKINISPNKMKIHASSHRSTVNKMKVKQEDESDQSEMHLLKFLIDLLHLEHEVEQLKCDLTNQSEFTIMDVFHFIDRRGQGSVNQNELEYFCKNSLKMKSNSHGLSLFMQRLDKDDDGKIRYSDFNDFLQPINKKYKSGRQPVNYESSYTFSQLLTVQTQFIIRDLFTKSFDNEIQIQGMKKTLAQVDISRFYRVIDRQGKGFIDLQDLNMFFSNYNISFNELNLMIIIKWFSGNNCINYQRFMNTLTDQLD